MPRNSILSLAIRAAERSKDRWRVGAVIYSGSRILGIGSNDMTRTHTRSGHPFKTIHAETAALLRAANGNAGSFRGFLRGSRIYVHRLRRDGLPGLAAPCQHCQSTLRFAGISRIEYSLDPIDKAV